MPTLAENIARNNQFHSDLRDLITENGGTIPADTPCEDLLPIIEDMFGGGSSADTEYLKSMIERPTNAEIVIPQGTTVIGDEAFYNFRTLRNVSIPNSVTSIGDYAFFGCTTLITLTIPNSVISIGADAFSGCKALTELIIPNSVTSISDTAFYGCYALTSVTLGQGFNCNNLNFSWSSRLSVETLVAMFEALADRTGETAYTLTIGGATLAKLTAEQKAIATNKNWNLV